MNELEKDTQKLDYDAIMRMFGVADSAEAQEDRPSAPVQEETDSAQTPDAPMHQENADELLPDEEEGDSLEESTSDDSFADDTIRLDRIDVTAVTSSRYQPVDEDEEDAEDENESDSSDAEEEPEPFSKEWEPEYDQPIGEYTPPQPIVFRPRSRLKELRKELVAGPEKRYYQLTEMGLGRLQAAMFVNGIVLLLCIGSTAMYSLGMVQPDRMRLLVFGQIFAMLVSALLGSYQLLSGLGDIFRLRFSPNSLLLFTFLVCCVDGMLCLQELRVPCCAAFGLSMGMSLWGTYHKRSTEMGQMDTMRQATHLDGIILTEDYHQELPGFQMREAEVSDFMDRYSRPSTPEKILSVYSFLALIFSVAIGVAAAVLHNSSLGIQVCATSLLVALPSSTFIALARPESILEQRLHKLGAVLCGWQGIKSMNRKAFYPLNDEALFPAGSTKLNGVKFYGDRDPDDVVAYAAALVNACGGGLSPLFSQLLDRRSGRHHRIENLQYHESGIGAEVLGEPVLVGTLSCMQKNGISVPSGTKVKQAVYAAIAGEVCGVFAISYAKSKFSATGLVTLCSYRGLTPLLTARDFMLSESFLRSKFRAKTRRIHFPDHAIRGELDAKVPSNDAPVCAITTKDGLAPRAFAITGARALRSASIAGLALHLFGGILGLAIMGCLAYLGSAELLTPTNVLLYEFAWIVPGLLITEWTRAI